MFLGISELLPTKLEFRVSESVSEDEALVATVSLGRSSLGRSV